MKFELKITGETEYNGKEEELDTVIDCLKEDLEDAGWKVEITKL